MAKEKQFRSGKRNRPKSKKREEVEEKKEHHWKAWGKRHKKSKSKRRDYQLQELSASPSNQLEWVSHKRKKNRVASTDEWISANRERTTGLSANQLNCEMTIVVTSYHVLTEINLAVDHEKIILLRKQKHNKNLISILNKIP